MNLSFPIEYYYTIYYNVILVFVLLLFVQSYKTELQDEMNLYFKNVIGFVFMAFVIFYIGLRPIDIIFVDMTSYAHSFGQIKEGVDVKVGGDFGWDNLMSLSVKLMNVESFFFLCALLYIVPLWAFSKLVFEKYWFYSFIILVGSFSFLGYGTNGIRNGIATSIFVLALSFHKKQLLLFFLFLIAISFHKSMLLPVLVFAITYLFNEPKKYMIIWLLAIPLSLAFSGFWENFFANIGFIQEDKLSYLITVEGTISELNNTFRWDFLLYSSIGIFSGWYYIVKKNYQDQFYYRLFNTYALVNAFWILVIRANFSNRFAYLSWFMLGIVMIYPLLKVQMFNNQHQIFARILLLYFMLTYFMFI
jgi:hypothetical protein